MIWIKKCRYKNKNTLEKKTPIQPGKILLVSNSENKEMTHLFTKKQVVGTGQALWVELKGDDRLAQAF